MARLSTNDTDLSYIAEVTPGTTPATPAFQLLPFTGGAPEFQITTVMSDAIRSDRQTDDIIVTDATVTGAINFELSYAAYKPFLIEVLRSAAVASPYANGISAPTTYTFLKRILDGATTYYHYYTGCVIKSMSLSLSTASKVTGTMKIVGRGEEATTSEIASSTYVDAANYVIMNASSNIDSLTVGGTSTCVQSMDITFENNSEGSKCLGFLGNSDVDDFGFDVTASMDTFFEDLARYNVFKNSTAFAVAMEMTDGNGNQFDLSLPRCKWESLNTPISGKNQFLTMNGSIRALRDSATGYTAQFGFTDA